MESKTLVIEVPPGVGRVCIHVWPASDDRPHGWEEISVASARMSNWIPIEMTAGSFQVQDERGDILRSSGSAA